MAKLRHLAFVCKDPSNIADFMSKAFDLEILYQTEAGVVVLTDGVINFTLLTESFYKSDPAAWHFGFELSQEEIEARMPLLKSLGAELHDGVRDGRPIEAFIRTPEGHRIDMAPSWPTQKGQSKRATEYRSWAEPAEAAASS